MDKHLTGGIRRGEKRHKGSAFQQPSGSVQLQSRLFSVLNHRKNLPPSAKHRDGTQHNAIQQQNIATQQHNTTQHNTTAPTHTHHEVELELQRLLQLQVFSEGAAHTQH